jgi:hemerythrin-like domain-containing protein
MDRIETLCAEHRQIRILVDRLSEYIARSTPPDPVEFLYFRREFGRTLVRHLKKEDWLIYPRLKASSRSGFREIAERLCSELGSFEEAFGSYARRWTSDGICKDWLGFREDTLAMVQLLHRRMALEESELYPLIDVWAPSVARFASRVERQTSSP